MAGLGRYAKQPNKENFHKLSYILTHHVVHELRRLVGVLGLGLLLRDADLKWTNDIDGGVG